MLKGFPCKVVETAVAHPGKHGHSKIHFVGLNVFTGRKYEDITPSQDMIEVGVACGCGTHTNLPSIRSLILVGVSISWLTSVTGI